MCERGTVLDRLAAMEKAGSIVVNSPAAIRNTYRHRMVELFARNRVSAPDQLDRRGRREQAAAGRLRLGQALRLPRDPDATTSCMRRRRRGGARRCAVSPSAAFRSSSRRSMCRATSSNSTACGTARAPNDANWFQWFYHRDKGMLGHSFDPARLRKAALRRGRRARARGLRRRRGHQGQRRADDHRPQRVAELRALPRSRRAGDRRLPDRALPAAPALGRLSKELIC